MKTPNSYVPDLIGCHHRAPVAVQKYHLTLQEAKSKKSKLQNIEQSSFRRFTIKKFFKKIVHLPVIEKALSVIQRQQKP